MRLFDLDVAMHMPSCLQQCVLICIPSWARQIAVRVTLIEPSGWASMLAFLLAWAVRPDAIALTFQAIRKASLDNQPVGSPKGIRIAIQLAHSGVQLRTDFCYCLDFQAGRNVYSQCARMLHKHHEKTLPSLRARVCCLTECKHTQPAADRHQHICLLVIQNLQAV